MGIEKRVDISLIGALALREKRIQQNDRPIIAVYKSFARRPRPDKELIGSSRETWDSLAPP
jgi:hypothetical protein